MRRIATTLLSLTARLLPRGQRARWREEWDAELAVVATRGAWAVCRLLAGAPADAWAARRAGRHATSPGRWRAAWGADLSYAGRQLLRRPGHTVAVVACLVVGLVVSVGTFSALSALLFGQLPGIANRQDIARVRLSYAAPAGSADTRITDAPLALDDLALMRARADDAALDTVAVEGDLPMTVSTGRGATRVTGAFASGDFFPMLGTTALAGRLLGPDDDRSGAAPVAVVTAHFWHTALDGRPDAIGRPILLAGRSFTVVGVAPPRFHGLHILDLGQDDGAGIQVWIPLEHARSWPGRPRDDEPWFTAAGRLRPGRTLADATTGFDVSAARLAAASPATRGEATAIVRGYGLRARDTSVMALLVALIMLLPLTVLAIGCANVANLQLARATERTRELAVRLSIGASRGQVLRLLTLETLARTLVALALAWVGVRSALRYANGWLPLDITMDWRVAAFAAALAGGVALLTGLFPGWLVLRTTTAGHLKQTSQGGGARYGRLRAGLVVTQVALSLALLVIALLFTRTMQDMLRAAPPALSEQLVMTFAPGELGRSPIEARALADDVVARVAADARVRHVALSERATARVHTPAGTSRPWEATVIRATPAWRAVADLTLLSGQWIDGNGVVVSRRAAERIADNGQALGRTVLLATAEGTQRAEVVGIVEDQPVRPTRERPGPVIYAALPAALPGAFSITVRSDAPDVLQPDLGAMVTAADPDLTWVSVRRGDAAFMDDAREMASAAVVVGVSAVLALALSATGLFAVVSYFVTMRRREIGIRLAIGATTGGIVRLIVRQCLGLAGGGAALGLALAFPIAAFMHATFVEKVDHLDPVVYAGPVALIALVAALAAALPARRAARVDPIATLRQD